MSDPNSRLDCPHAAQCSGCPLLGEDYDRQLHFKRERLVRALRPYPELEGVAIAPTVRAERTTGYRVRAKLVAKGRALGLYSSSGHRVVDIPECRVLSPSVSAAVAKVREQLPFRFQLLALDVREVDGGALLTLIVDDQTEVEEVRRVAATLVARHAGILGISVARRAPNSPRVLGSVPEPVVGLPVAPHHLSPNLPWHHAVPGGFVQAHAGQASLLYAKVAEAIEQTLGTLAGRRVLELYAGAGALALCLAARGASVTAVDVFAPSLAWLQAAARAQGLRLETRAQSAEQALETAGPAEVVIVDPPRRGLSPSLRAALKRVSPRLLIYVSCEPRTLARDLAHLARFGLAASVACPWDLIPHSDSTESIVVLKPEAPPDVAVLYQDDRLIVLDKPALWPISAGVETPHAESLLAQVRALAGGADAVPIDALDAGASGVCAFARSPRFAGEIRAALADAPKKYLVLARGVVRARGRLRHGRSVTVYVRERVVGTHSLLSLETSLLNSHGFCRQLAAIGHPLLGDRSHGDSASNRHFEERHGLDRPFLHRAELEWTSADMKRVIVSPLPGDLVSVLDSLEQTLAAAESKEARLRSVEAQKSATSRE